VFFRVTFCAEQRLRRMPLAIRWLGSLALLASAFGCGDEPKDQPGPSVELELAVDSITLENGMEVVTVPNATAPVVTALVAFRAGSAVESAELNGYSHLFEHMMFQGSTALPDPLEFRAQLEELGASYNGTTSVDRVTYFFTVPASALDPALGLFADVLQAPALDPTILEKEKGVVFGEFDLNESQPSFLSLVASEQLLYGADAVRLNPLGSRETVGAVTREQLQAMHDRYYVPNNALLVFSGALTPEQGHELARRHFGDWARAPDPHQQQPPVTPQPVPSPQYGVIAADVTFSTIQLWWPGPTLESDPDAALAGQILSLATRQADHGFRSLYSQDVLDAQLIVSTYRRAASTMLGLVVVPGREQAVLARVRNVVEALGEPGNVNRFQLAVAQDQVFSGQVFGQTSPTDLPGALADAWGNGDWRDYLDITADAYAIDAAEITRFGRSYLRGRPRVSVLTSNPDNIVSQGIDAAWLEKAIP
jgi:zinc protease